MEKKAVSGIMLILMFTFGILPIELAEAQAYTVHFICETMNRGDQGSITFAGTTYYSGQSAGYSSDDYWVTGNPPSPTTDWFFYRWQVLWIGSQSWVDNEYSQSTTFHLRGEAYLNAEFYSPIYTDNPTSPITWGTRQRITGTATQYSGQSLSVIYYPQSSGMGPPNRNGVPPFGGSGYHWTTIAVSSGSWDTGLIYPTLPISLGQQLPQTYDVYASWASGSVNEVDSNVVSFALNPASVQIAAPTLTPSNIELEQSVIITDQIFSSAYVNSNDLTGTLTVQAKRQGTSSWIDVASQSFTSTYGYSSVYGEYGVYYDISETWTPEEAGTYDVRIIYSGNNLYSEISDPPTSQLGVGTDMGIVSQLQHKDTELLCLGTIGLLFQGGCTLTGDHAWDVEHQNIGCEHDEWNCAPASISMINSYYGGHLSQDRISFYVMHERNHNPVPEGDLCHGRGLYPEEIYDALRWALNDATIAHHSGKPSFSEIRGWIDSNRPVLRLANEHVTVIDGYRDIDSFVHVINPMGGIESWRDYSALNIQDAWIPPADATARSDEATLSLDTDGDGVCDFDEIHRFITDPYNPDTDGDLVPDKQEIISYTFLPDGSFDLNDERRPDHEYGLWGDGQRCELDIDSDNGGTTDGLEDLNRNGIVDPGETDPLNPFDDPLRAASVRFIALSPVNLLVTDPDNRRVGYDPETQSVVNEIPGATYSGPASEPQEIIIPNSLNGTYRVEAIGTDIGPYSITVESIDSNSSVIDSDTWQGDALPGEVDSQNVRLESDGSFILPHDIEIANIISPKTIVGQGQTMNITVAVRNQGNYTETFNVTVYANTTIIEMQPITLTGGDSTIITYTWNTTGFVYGNYTINANATLVSGETDTTDNTLEDGIVLVTIAGDVNGDGIVDGFDFSLMGGAYRAEPGDSNWNPNCDINDDCIVNGVDFSIAGGNYRKTLP